MIAHSPSQTRFDRRDFIASRFGALTPAGVRLRPLPISFPIEYQTATYIEVNNVDRSAFVEWQNFQVSNLLTKQIDTAEFSFKMTGSSSFSVTSGDTVKIYDSGSLIFQGIVSQVRKSHISADLIRVQCNCVDFTHELDSKIVAEIYTSQTASYIIKDIIQTYAPQFTVDNVDANQVINYIAFTYQTPSACLKQLAEMIGYEWWVDQYKDIHFKVAGAETAPFTLTDTNGSYLLGTLNVQDDISQIRNTIFLRGGNETGASQTYSKVADGTQLLFNPGYHFSAKPTVTVASVAKTVGIEGVDDAASFDCIWNSQRDYVLFKSATKPAASAQVDISGLPINQILLKLPERTSVALYGERDFVIIDKTINTRDGARQRALAELIKYAEKLVSIQFTTLTKGLSAGQLMTATSGLFDLSGDYVITAVTTTAHTPTSFQYAVTLVSTRLMDIVDLLIKLLNTKEKTEIYNPNDQYMPTEIVFEDATIVEAITSATSADVTTTETATIGESVTLPGGTGLDFGTIFVAGPWTPSTTKRVFNLDRSPLSG